MLEGRRCAVTSLVGFLAPRNVDIPWRLKSRERLQFPHSPHRIVHEDASASLASLKRM